MNTGVIDSNIKTHVGQNVCILINTDQSLICKDGGPRERVVLEILRHHLA